ncbi:uncharacterized protein UTRI_04186 [Ustilago trichophora]|uniref:Homeobox domain-containing protein n=1 Tax=Ustilago trichophora TaxID=86804 RepID=A0A5C3EDR7_9BASI|nr:uncharacterized protein UTRI_04186_B [Ustilago trichophora]SPO32442.1 uncharacterized protein UTRI_04186 [Ustilago trichophora]
MERNVEHSLLSMLAALESLEQEVLISKEEIGTDLLIQSEALTLKAQRALLGDLKDMSTATKIYQTISRIKTVLETRLQLDRFFSTLCRDLVQETLDCLESNKGSLRHRTDRVSIFLPNYHLREYFLKNLHDPYPSSKDKEMLARVTNASVSRISASSVGQHSALDIRKVSHWFINARRRSGWSRILRTFAKNDHAKMQLLVKTKLLSSIPPVESPSKSSSVTQTLDEVLTDTFGRQLTAAEKKEFDNEWLGLISWTKFGVKEIPQTASGEYKVFGLA